ncbi:pentapeptide repeat-containing protein [Arthrobacter sp. EH-1B-1]|uniref:Pentapeptide repeat-containing protein n=1 Tax=Arthrobacter vasquezii TaxID=2977629 RepID=A0ABT6CWJ2_9MICC|nr:pentapeptide repeat-containing protein [Arthrobacter vasquezii]MDF9278426.1 pentapeptide repeat-containing protein [Arthrobacter vasquezii]
MAGWLRELLFRDVLIAAVVGLVVGLVSGFLITNNQAALDDARAEREMTAARELAEQAIRIENLRFVRDRASRDASEWFFDSLDLSNVSLGPLMLRGADFTGAIFEGTRMDSADVAGALFVETSMTGARGSDTNFSGADFTGATLDKAVFGANFEGATMHRVSAIGANFQGAEMEGADFDGADLRGANLFDTTLVPDDFEGTCYDDNTSWPDDFIPPPSAALKDCGPNQFVLADPAPPIDGVTRVERSPSE